MCRYILLCLAFLLISGCATMPETRLPVPNNASEGAVLVRFLPNTESASTFMKNWQSVVVQQESTAADQPGPTFAMKPDLSGTSRSATYMAALPPGRYRFVEFSSYSCGLVCISERIRVNEKFSRFEVRPQQLTDLGVIIQTPDTRERSVLLAHVASDDNQLVDEMIREMAPALVPMLDKPKAGWSADTVPEQMPLLAEFSKRVSHGFVQPREAAPGQFIFGTANGALGIWAAGERAEGQFDLGVHRSVETVLVTSGGAWLAGGELSLLMQSDDQGKHWRSMRGNLPLALVLDLHEWKGNILATLVRGTQVEVYSATSGTSEWRRLGQYRTEFNLFWDIPGVYPRSLLIDDHLLVAVPSRQLAALNLITGVSELRDLPGGMAVLSASDDKILRCKCIRGIIVNPWESADMGKTWTPSTVPRFIQEPAFRDRMHGVAYEGGVISSGKLVRTEDGGKTWTPSIDIAFPISRLFYQRDRSAVYAATPYGSVWQSKDDGQTWGRVR
jgi:hypothetical protein